jgi:hypothetical protein
MSVTDLAVNIAPIPFPRVAQAIPIAAQKTPCLEHLRLYFDSHFEFNSCIVFEAICLLLQHTYSF